MNKSNLKILPRPRTKGRNTEIHGYRTEGRKSQNFILTPCYSVYSVVSIILNNYGLLGKPYEKA